MDIAGQQMRAKFRWKSVPLVYWVVLIMLSAAALRVCGVHRISPPGLEHDEVANWLIDRSILEGQHAIYFAEAYGHEAGFHYMQALAVALVGDNALALRLPAIFSGLLLIAIHFALSRRLFGAPVALISTVLLAVLFWSVFYSRLGLRAIMLPFVSGISLYCWMQGWGAPGQVKSGRVPGGRQWSSRSLLYFMLGGLFAALTLYVYMAARAVPVFYGLFVIYLLVFHRSDFKQRWRGVLLFAAVFLAFSMPLLLYLRANPTAEFRVTEIDAPLRAILAGDWRPVLQNGLKIGGMFGLAGDPLWRQNVAGRPVFGPVLAILFYAGILLALWRWRWPRYAFLLLWLGTSAIPSLVTVDAPSSIRMINALLVVTVFPALVIHNLTRFSTAEPKFSTRLAYLLAILLTVSHIWWTYTGVFHRWPENDEVQFVWQKALTETAAFLDQADAAVPTAVGGWSPATMDPPTMLLTMRRSDMDLRYFGSDSTAVPVKTLLIPQGSHEARAWITRPTIRDLAPELEAQLQMWGASPQHKGSFVLYEVALPLQVEASISEKQTFDDQLQLLGYSVTDGHCRAENCRVLSYWQVLAPSKEPLRFFMHAVDDQGGLIAQDDALDAPARYWQAGDILVQLHALDLGSRQPAELRLGVYEPQTGRRLTLFDGSDHFTFAVP